MANVRDSDTSLWLHNKLGTSNDSWTGGSICSQLDAEVLMNIKDCFPDLQTQVKLKLLLSFFHIPRRNVEEWRNELEEIIEVAVVDSELWVSMLAETMKTFPATGSLNTEISDFDETRPIFTDLVNDLKKHVNKQADIMSMLPLECHYLNKAALISVVGQQPTPVKHFVLKKKPKSAILRAELLQKSADAQSNVKKSTAPTVPVRSRGMPRKMTDTTPLKGIPSRVPTSGFRSPPTNISTATGRPTLVRTPAGRKDGGIKLLDITEQPLGYAAAKKRKRMQELEEQKKATDATGSLSATTNSNTPDYAAGLTSTVVFAQPSTPGTPTPKENSTTPISSSPVSSGSITTGSVTASSEISTPAVSYTNPVSRTPFSPPHIIQSTQQTVILSPNVIQSTNLLTPEVPPPTPITNVHKVIVEPNPILKSKTQTVILANSGVLQKNVIVGVQKGAIVSKNMQQKLQQPNVGGLNLGQIHQIKPITTITPTPINTPPANITTTRVTHVRLQPQTTQPQQRKGLSLTKPQMMQAQEMFSKANKVTRPEKALILGFMAGSRENPCPDLGHTVTIKLSENQENVLQEDDTYVTMWVETHFQMNYQTGAWEKIKKLRKLDEDRV